MCRIQTVGLFLLIFPCTINAYAAGYTCPTYKEYISCNSGYVLNSTGPGNACVAVTSKCSPGFYLADNGTCTECPDGYYCTDDEKFACPAPKTHAPTSGFPEKATNLRFGTSSFGGGGADISGCAAQLFFNSDQGSIYSRATYNPETQKYDNIWDQGWEWYRAMPGYYLTDQASAQSRYYYDVAECLPGHYCPGKTSLYLGNPCTECGETFGIEECDAGTYSAAGAAACTVCPDDTWSDTGATECTACDGTSNGYGNSGDDAENHAGPTSCTTQCDAGYYVPDVGDACTKIQGTIPYYAEAHSVAYGDTSGDNYKKCPDPAKNSAGGKVSNSIHTHVKYCLREAVPQQYVYDPTSAQYCHDGICIHTQTTHGLGHSPCYYTSGEDGNAIYDDTPRPSFYRCVGNAVLDSCDAGYWAPLKMYGGGVHFLPCQPVETGYYSPDGDLNRYPCPDGTMTVGFGDGAATAADCVPMRKLHMGDKTVPLAARKYSRPALATQMSDGSRYYGYMIAGTQSGTMNAQLPTGTYSLISPLDQFERTMHPGGAGISPFEIYIVP